MAALLILVQNRRALRRQYEHVLGVFNCDGIEFMPLHLWHGIENAGNNLEKKKIFKYILLR